MKMLLGLVLAATCALYTFAPIQGNAKSHKNTPKPPTEIFYTLELIDAEMWGPIDINNRGDVLIERQLVPFASPLPLIITKNGKETAAFECPGTTKDTTGEGINSHGEIVGHCGHGPGAPGLFAFVANPKIGSLTLLAYPGAQTTWGYGINDFGDVVGFYTNRPEPPSGLPFRNLHSFFWDKTTNEYRTIDNPLAELVGGFTWLTGINNKGQIVGHYNTLQNVQSQEYQFIYDNGIFTPIEFPGANHTHITGFNNNSQILGWYEDHDGDCPPVGVCIFLFDSGDYFTINLPLPPNEPRPDGVPAGFSLLNVSALGGLNDKGQFVGSYSRILEWGLDIFGNLAPSVIETVNFIATPHKMRKK